MDKLVTYVSAIHGHVSPVAILKQTVQRDSWSDQGFDVQKEETRYTFDNGVVIRRVVEQDQFPTELVCAECWISYEVIEQPSGSRVSPAKKNFDNACREAFWLKYYAA
ncbi:hypothetical protein [Paraburkholderia phenazinium]|jgi:hypothetical protein|uniref:Uncharacterized protein n=1 Tax=Paraburkholderia phenazinium TaxID=60549 RepID=A0A1G8GY22_9BURK|nr:hypothetical protein [Paraburkholderia phenazinium]SDH99293.1 hypothetical protein SAMN05216466_115198 [Paraburkholderia phenazinium]